MTPAGIVAAALLLTLSAGSSASAASSTFGAGLAGPALESPAAPTIIKVAPATGPVAGGTAVSITGTNFTGATEVAFGSNAASFSVKSAGKIEAVAPPGVEGTVEVTVTTPEGTSSPSPNDHFSYVPPGPVVLELQPGGGLKEGGKEVKIFGANFEGATEVRFGTTSAVFSVLSSEEIRVTTAPATNPTEDVRVSTPEGTSPITPADVFEYRGPPPQVSGLSPDEGPAAGGNPVSISGVEFYGVTGVWFGTLAVTSFTVVSPGLITTTAPADMTEKVEVFVQTTFGETGPYFCPGPARDPKCKSLNHYKYLPPTVTNVTPGSGPAAGGTHVTITGTGFGPGTTKTQVTIGKALATSVDCTSFTTCTAVTPPAKKERAGVANVTVKVQSNEKAGSKKKEPGAEFDYE